MWGRHALLHVYIAYKNSIKISTKGITRQRRAIDALQLIFKIPDQFRCLLLSLCLHANLCSLGIHGAPLQLQCNHINDRNREAGSCVWKD